VSGSPFTPMLASTGPLPRGPGWAYELKWDGIRAIAVCRRGVTRLYGRRGNEVSAAYPELAGIGREVDDAVLDGEVVVLDAAGRPSFARLAERMHVRDRGRAARLAHSSPVTYMVFDVLRLGGIDLLEVPYSQRRLLLEGLDLHEAHCVVPPSFEDGPATAAASADNGLEGVVAKRLAAPYRPGIRSPDWVKVKSVSTGEFVVGGWRPGARAVGALLVGVPQGGGLLAYRGRVGGGISAAAERELASTLRPLVVQRSPFGDTIPREDSRTAVWVRPEVVVELKFGERTPEHRLRFPRFLRLRPDLTPQDVVDE
jgi:bifunctional non-homologous end joining protein LigD